MEYTGFKLYDEPLFVGDILSHYGGYDGYRKVIKKDDKFYLINCSAEIYKIKEEELGHEIEPPFELKRDLYGHYEKVDPNNPLKTPLMEMTCDICQEHVGDFDVDTGQFTWFDNYGWHKDKDEGYMDLYCKNHIPKEE